ncbi:MAG: tRNA threonylcarbamoyladenosine dehydratase [Lentisphaeria bacterium]|nr:tRNA threonylcarbamoyladenosine dehydratase [Lentisphaeria bacterium]
MSFNTDWQDRTRLLLGENSCDAFRDIHVLVVGLGGVGAYAAEMICRAGIGRMTIVDGDLVETTNLNRQLAALHSTLGQEKALVIGERLKDINPELDLRVISEYLTAERMGEVLSETRFDCVIDAIDSLAPKVELARCCVERDIPIVCSMGAGARMDPEQIRCVDVSKTFNCGLARAFRHGLSRYGIRKGVCTVFSSEQPVRTAIREERSGPNKCSVTGTISFIPAIFGCHCAAAAIRLILEKSGK